MGTPLELPLLLWVIDLNDIRRFALRRPNRQGSLPRVTSRRLIEALTWEGGAAKTMASGPSSCAIDATAVKRRLADRRVTITMSGGILTIEAEPDSALRMTVPATPLLPRVVLVRRSGKLPHKPANRPAHITSTQSLFNAV